MTAKILIVDDHPINRQLLIALLEGGDHLTFEAQDGKEGLEILYSMRPDLVITDLMMPVMDGYEFVRRLRADPAVSAMPVIFYTASHLQGKDAQELAKMCGVRYIITKPSEPETILRTVEAALAEAGQSQPQPSPEDFSNRHVQVLTDKLTRKVYENKRINLRLAALVEISTDLFGKPALRPKLEAFCHAAREIIGARHAVVRVLTEGRPPSEHVAASHCTNALTDDEATMPFDALVAEMRENIHMQVAAHPRKHEPITFVFHGEKCALFSASTGNLRAWLYLKGKHGDDDFNKEDGWIVSTLINQFAALYENQMLYERLYMRNRELEAEIEERENVKADLRNSERRFRALIENSSDAIALVDTDFNILYASPSTTQLLGYRPHEFVGLNAFELLRSEDHQRIQDTLSEIFKSGEGNQATIQAQVRHKDGRWRWMEGVFTNLLEEPSVGAIVVNYRDVTERKLSEETLRESEARLRLSVQAGNIGLWDWNLTTNVVYFSPEWKSQLGYREDEIPSRFEEWQNRVHPDDLVPTLEKVRCFLKAPTSEYMSECRLRHKDGSWRWILTQAQVFLDAAGRPARMMGCHIDITERQQTAEHLAASREQLRALTAHLQSIREQERTSIAREIHDVLGQSLTGLKMDISWLDKKLAGVEVSREKIMDRMKSMLTLVDETICTVQDISSQLRPGVLDNIGLAAAIEWQAREFQTRTEIDCVCELPETEPPLDGERATAMFRIFQETLTNVARHSGAAHVHIRFSEHDRDLILRIEDDGRGIALSEIEAPTSLGLLGMRERAQLFGGDVVIERVNGCGTVVTARMPHS